jgi:hypothetical protein
MFTMPRLKFASGAAVVVVLVGALVAVAVAVVVVVVVEALLPAGPVWPVTVALNVQLATQVAVVYPAAPASREVLHSALAAVAVKVSSAFIFASIWPTT